ncbi:MAG: aminodeoxychorismate synthase, component I [Isosphaeraceae bacterium]|nr:MAG: aminodeoxychorismate synthase, component I [Isosphaeraceae bacterium]
MIGDRALVLRRELGYEPRALARRMGRQEEPAILESAAGVGEAARWSVLAAWPRLVFEAVEARWRIVAEPGVLAGLPRQGGDPLGGLRLLLGALQLDEEDDGPGPNEPPFRGGLIGLIGYDLAPRLERLPRRLPRTSQIPDLRFGLYDTFVVIDHGAKTAAGYAVDLIGEGCAATRARLDRLVRVVDGREPERGSVRLAEPLRSDFSREEYQAAVARAIEYIRAGDIFQANLSQRFAARLEQCDPLALYESLVACSPAPFAAYLRWGDRAVVSASPEWFYQTRGRSIVTRPIKGTRPRGATPQRDAALLAELANSPKDRAELTMIIDLERNDLGRVCEVGSIEVVAPYTVESYEQVHHLVATIGGTLRAGIGPVEVVAAMFPGGSITGAPKIRAMEIIDELERSRRSLYTGAIGYYSRGASGFSIAIRTLLVEGEVVSYQVGGGIVADSDPEAEYEETLHKGRGLREALEAAGGC